MSISPSAGAVGQRRRTSDLVQLPQGRVGGADIQLTPATAEVMAVAVLTGELPEIAQAFSSRRFGKLSAA